MRSLYDVVVRPIISEKSTALAEVANKYVFEVNADSRKEEIRDAVQRLFGVQVRAVRTMIMQGKSKRTARSVLKKSNWKKAIVTLADGQKIDFYQTK
jgi:large subunit ribosomal protein L23